MLQSARQDGREPTSLGAARQSASALQRLIEGPRHDRDGSR
jgi:hypothetical protein